jgi:radical SAM superfamily enzyme YgiQ (UPF0313 family)
VLFNKKVFFISKYEAVDHKKEANNSSINIKTRHFEYSLSGTTLTLFKEINILVEKDRKIEWFTIAID